MAIIRTAHRAPERGRRAVTRPSATREQLDTADRVALLALQRLAGNKAVLGLMARGLERQPGAVQALRSPVGPHSSLVVQRVLSIGSKPVPPSDYTQVHDFCKKKLTDAGITWNDGLAATLKTAMDHRTKNYSVDDPGKLVDALRGYATNKTAFPAGFAVTDIDLNKAAAAHELRQTMRYWGVNELAAEQMPATASVFHDLPETDVAPLESYGYEWARTSAKYDLTQERGTTPREMRFQPFGENSLDATIAEPGQVFGYNATVGSGESRELAFGLVKNLKGTKRKAPERKGRDEAYGGLEMLENMTRGHMNPQWVNADVLDDRPVKRMRSRDYEGTEDFTPKKTAASPNNFYAENIAYGESIRKFVEGKLVREGGTLRHYNIYGATPATVKAQVEGKGGGEIHIPYPSHVILDLTLPKGAEFYKDEKLSGPGRFAAKFPNAPDVDYSSGVMDPATKKMQYAKFQGGEHKKTRKKLARGKGKKKTGGGAREHFKGNEIATADIPKASIFKPRDYRISKPAGDYTADQEYKPGHRHSVPGYMSPPPSPLLTLGAEEKTVTIDGKHRTGDKTPDGAQILSAEYDEKTKKTTCTVSTLSPFDPASWTT